MTKFRMAATAVLTSCAVTLGAAGTASAQEATTTPLTQQVAVAGSKKLDATYTIKRFETRGSKVVAVGTLKGKVRGQRFTKRNVRMPATLTKREDAAASQQPPNPTPGACQILDLVLQPIDLNLLGLRVATSRIEVLIEGIPGAGALLGNLLCGITGILDPQGQSAGNLAAALNSILALVPRSA